MYINGQWTDSVAGKTRSIINPFNQEIIAEVAEGNRVDAELAIKAARETFDKGIWANTPASERGAMVYELGRLIERDKEELATLESLNTGKTIEESRWDMDSVVGTLKYYGGLADKDGGEVIDSPFPDSNSQVVREPVGVCSQISPWNYPLLQASWKMAPALAAGCTIVMKPSEITPLTTIKATELAIEAGFPNGVVNLVLGQGGSVGAELAENIDVDMISFTGGIDTGKTIIKAASSNVKKITLELGGKNPNIIFADADLTVALDYVLNGVFFNAGQVCSAGARVMVEKPIYDSFIADLKMRMKAIKIGNGFDEETQMGPLISKEHRNKIEHYVKIAKSEGATLALGGKRPEDLELQDGFFFLPTLFTHCTDEMRIVKEEVFGPVITVESFQSEDEVVRRANNTIYGLSAGFWTNDHARIKRVSSALRFGTVWINDFNTYFAQAPWGGYKQSGMGRELGKNGIKEYTEVKHIIQNHNPKPLNWFGVKQS